MSSNYIKKVAVVGASGHVGGAMVTELLKTGKHSITAITREDSTSTMPSGVAIARVDYSSEESLVSALRGHDFLILTLHVMAPRDTHGKVVRAAVKAGIPWIMPNVFGYDINNEKLNEESLFGAVVKSNMADVRNADINYVVLSCGFWYEWSLAFGEHWYGFDIPNRKAVFFGDGTTKINTSTLPLCGKAVAKLLSLPIKADGTGPALEDWKNNIVFISSFLISQRDMLDALNRTMGTTDADWKIEHDPVHERYANAVAALQKGDQLGFVRGMYTRHFFPGGEANYEDKYGLANEKLGLEKENIDDITKWLVEYFKKEGKNPFTQNNING